MIFLDAIDGHFFAHFFHYKSVVLITFKTVLLNKLLSVIVSFTSVFQDELIVEVLCLAKYIFEALTLCLSNIQ